MKFYKWEIFIFQREKKREKKKKKEIRENKGREGCHLFIFSFSKLGYKVIPFMKILSHCKLALLFVKVSWQAVVVEEEEEEAEEWMAREFLMLAKGQFVTRMAYFIPCSPIWKTK
jgi:hypothetical protein